MQESFGLTPIEAMAAGLPRVISDWDGYRDSVTEGEDGFLIRTMQPPAGNGFDLTAQVLSGREVYGGFLAKTALTVAVDAAQAGDRIARLIQHPNLRARMAEKAKARVQAVYDWRHIIPAYESLWQELAEQRGRDVSPSAAYGEALPELPDPYTMYESYPTSALALSDRLSLAVDIGQIKTLWGHHLNTYAGDVLLPPQDLSALVGWVGENKDARIEAVLARFPAGDTSRVWRTIAWLQKLGIFKNSACQESAGE